MSQINVKGLVNNISEKTTIYTSIIEAVVNSIESIEEGGRDDGVINIILNRDIQPQLEPNEDVLPRITSIEIHDNGIGFNDKNLQSFDTLYSDQKIKWGGKGFGRFMFLKYFEKVEIDSYYQKEREIYHRIFAFSGKSTNADSLVENLSTDKTLKKKLATVLILKNIKDLYAARLEKKLITIARNLVERLLPYFISAAYKCPSIILEEGGNGDKIVLNNYINEHEEIKQVYEKSFELKHEKDIEKFGIKIFKIYYTKSCSSIILTAHNRAVTTGAIYEYIPEFKDDFYDVITNNEGTVNKNYSIKAYILGDYLNKYVLLERDDFAFTKESSLLYPFSRHDIESEATKIIEEAFKDEVRSRKLKKQERIKQYIDTKAPWHKSYFQELDMSNIPYHADDVTLEGELQMQKFKREQTVTTKVSEILKSDEKEAATKIDKIYKELNELGKSDLVHYVILRKTVLDILNKSLKWNEDKAYEKEKVIHELIFPMNSDSDHIPYDKHNLWIIDERLSFQEYIASDRPLNVNDERPDILLFSRPIVVREGEETSNPITIFEFKKPQRKEYTEDDNPLDQIVEYIEKIRKGEFKDIDGRTIKANANTPAYGYLICDITEKIKRFCKQYDLMISPDNEGYFGFQHSYGIYLEVISFDKLVRDAELRNRIFFKKINLI